MKGAHVLQLLAMVVLGACSPEGATASCSLAGCAVAIKECSSGQWTPCMCEIASCDDGNPCTTDGPSANGLSCTHTPRTGQPCNDGNACTSGDACNASSQCAGTAIPLDDGNPCTNDTCSPATGPAHTPKPVNTACSDSSTCTSGDVCNATGTCVGTLNTTCGSVATFFCYDKYGNTSRKIVCLPNQSCPLSCQ